MPPWTFRAALYILADSPRRNGRSRSTDHHLEPLGHLATHFAHARQEQRGEGADLRGPRRVVGGHHEHPAVESKGADVRGHLRPGDLLPPPEHGTQRAAVTRDEGVGDRRERLGEGTRARHATPPPPHGPSPDAVPRRPSSAARTTRATATPSGRGLAVVRRACPAGRRPVSARPRAGSSSEK